MLWDDWWKAKVRQAGLADWVRGKQWEPRKDVVKCYQGIGEHWNDEKQEER